MERINWSTLDKEVAKLAGIVKESDVCFSGVVGILRGGAVPARILASQLAIADMYCLNVRKRAISREVTTDIQEDLSDRSLLLVEDVLETGDSLQTAASYLRSKGATVGTAALYFTEQTEIMPDFSLGQVSAVPRFPWEIG